MVEGVQQGPVLVGTFFRGYAPATCTGYHPLLYHRHL